MYVELHMENEKHYFKLLTNLMQNQQTWYLRVNTSPFLSVLKMNQYFLSMHPQVYCETQGKPGQPYWRLFWRPFLSVLYFQDIIAKETCTIGL